MPWEKGRDGMGLTETNTDKTAGSEKAPSRWQDYNGKSFSYPQWLQSH